MRRVGLTPLIDACWAKRRLPYENALNGTCESTSSKFSLYVPP